MIMGECVGVTVHGNEIEGLDSGKLCSAVSAFCGGK